MNSLNFRHEMSEDGWHRIVETTTNDIGNWAMYQGPAFLKIGDRQFSALTGYYGGVDRVWPPIETVFEMLTLHTERCEVGPRDNRSKEPASNQCSGCKQFMGWTPGGYFCGNPDCSEFKDSPAF